MKEVLGVARQLCWKTQAWPKARIKAPGTEEVSFGDSWLQPQIPQAPGVAWLS